MAYLRSSYFNCISEAGITYRVEFYDQGPLGSAASGFKDKERTPGLHPIHNTAHYGLALY